MFLFSEVSCRQCKAPIYNPFTLRKTFVIFHSFLLFLYFSKDLGLGLRVLVSGNDLQSSTPTPEVSYCNINYVYEYVYMGNFQLQLHDGLCAYGY